jgi:hypothetical protein
MVMKEEQDDSIAVEEEHAFIIEVEKKQAVRKAV